MKRSFTAVLVLAAFLLLILEILQPMYTGDPVKNGMIQTILTRTVGTVLFFLLIRKSGCPVLGLPDVPRKILRLTPLPSKKAAPRQRLQKKLQVKTV